MTITGIYICTRALRTAGVVGLGETPDADQLADAFAEVQELLDGWKVERLTIPVIEREVFALVGGVAEYTLGPGGDFNRQRPQWLDRYTGASILQGTGQNQLELPIEVISVQERQYLGVANSRSNLPSQMYCDFASPLAHCRFYPVPAVNVSAVLYCPTPLETFASETAQLVVPDGYVLAMRYNLAVRLADLYGKPISQTKKDMAVDTLANIKRANMRPVPIAVDPALTQPSGGIFNYFTGNLT